MIRAISFAVLLAFGGAAQASPRAIASARAKVEAAARAGGFPLTSTTTAHGERLSFAVSGRTQTRAFQEALHADGDVLEILHKSPNSNHTNVIFRGEVFHVEHIPKIGWRLDPRLALRGQELDAAPSVLLRSTVIALTPSEAERMADLLYAAHVAQGESKALDPNQNALRVAGLNCCSAWSRLPIGDQGETLHQLIGVADPTGNPAVFHESISAGGNARIVAAGTYVAFPDEKKKSSDQQPK